MITQGIWTTAFEFLIKIVFWIIGIIGTIVIYPVQVIIVTLIPNLGDAIAELLNFFSTSVFPIISFIKEICLDITCLPVELWDMLIAMIFARWAIAPAIRQIKLIKNIWKIKSGGNTN